MSEAELKKEASNVVLPVDIKKEINFGNIMTFVATLTQVGDNGLIAHIPKNIVRALQLKPRDLGFFIIRKTGLKLAYRKNSGKKGVKYETKEKIDETKEGVHPFGEL